MTQCNFHSGEHFQNSPHLPYSQPFPPPQLQVGVLFFLEMQQLKTKTIKNSVYNCNKSNNRMKPFLDQLLKNVL